MTNDGKASCNCSKQKSRALLCSPFNFKRRTIPLSLIGQLMNPAEIYKYDTPEVINTHSYYVVQTLKLCPIHSRDTYPRIYFNIQKYWIYLVQKRFCRVTRLRTLEASPRGPPRSTRHCSRSTTTTGTRPIETGSSQPDPASTSGRCSTQTPVS